jgi:hypothetical protein
MLNKDFITPEQRIFGWDHPYKAEKIDLEGAILTSDKQLLSLMVNLGLIKKEYKHGTYNH